MPRHTTAYPYRRRRTAAALAAIVAAGGLSILAAPAQAQPSTGTGDKLGSHDRALIAQYARQRLLRSTPAGADRPAPDFVTLMIAVRDGRTEQTERALVALGADVTRTESRVGYLKANVSFDDVEKVVALDDVVRVDVDELLKLDETRPDLGVTDATVAAAGPGAKPPAPSATTPADNAYLPTNETKSVDFKATHPTYDGRGVTIGIMDTGIDPTHPALATTTTGERKLVDTVVATSQTNFIDLLFDQTWYSMLPTNKVSGPTFTDRVLRQTWTGPADDDLHISVKKISISSLSGSYLGVLYRESDQAVWVDTDQDRDFTDEELMRPFKADRQVGYLGTDDPATKVNERVPFTVDIELDISSNGGDAVNINTLNEGHGTHVAGIAAANGMFGGAMDGQAPGATLVSMRACHSLGCSSAALTDGMIELATTHGVDVINMSIGASPALNDGQSAQALLYNRLIDETGVQMFISAGNSGAGANTVGDPTGADKVVSVGASVSRDTWWVNYGSKVTVDHDIMPFSSRGPREDGGFKPDITAPGSAVAPTPDWIPSASVAETGYTLPPGYSMMNGTSMASPQAAGAAALLLSAARQSGVDVTSAELRNAIYSSADFHRNVDVIAQGRGQMNVKEAWRYLRKDDRGVASDDVTVSAPVCTVLSGKLRTPHRGSGLFNDCAPGSGGQRVGESRDYTVTLTRTSGAAGPVEYQLRLVGDDGTFATPKTVALTKDVPATIQVTATPRTQGTHGAMLVVDSARTKAVEQHAMLVIEAAAPLTVGTTWSADGTVSRNGTVHYSVAVPAGTKSMTVDLSRLAEGSQTRWWAFSPQGVNGEKSAAGTIYCYANYLDGNGCDPLRRTYVNPEPGVWEFVVESRRTSPLGSNPFHLEASIVQ
ncbi:S8 family serine peptidase [Micromonospora sp. NPDC002717]|uniref:S8 family serine peptidase n=1 Tax=Micromonospora sp. NPDC002717 TaxID=3154424 RepID=UPI00332E708A